MTRPVSSVLLVCTGNVCRSPFAELLLRTRVPGITVASAGIDALGGDPMEHRMAEEARRRGADPAGFRARQVRGEDLAADLVLVMSERQRSHLREEDPSVVRRLGLLGHVPELAAIAARQGPGLDSGAVDRWTRQALPPGRDVPDPYRRPPEVAAATARRIESLVDQLAVLLTATGER
ncbi:hypothetical protein [Brachybacterium sp. YJGR34]|uniref:arsenate reductase/protein-tyrosine-phosphatase family protein n=1 Tax=Brachybacterium sp. YJGR34 TaxID=2059911 RepID=UPI000E0AAD8A|nr:hypothetical protein [Brachybacterium sp. YJGR34]